MALYHTGEGMKVTVAKQREVALHCPAKEVSNPRGFRERGRIDHIRVNCNGD